MLRKNKILFFFIMQNILFIIEINTFYKNIPEFLLVD
jgi:hypothetical protein